MGGSCNHFYGNLLMCFVFFVLVLEIRGDCLLNSEGLALVEFRAGVTLDPHGAISNWNPDDCDPCLWSGVHCVDGRVQILDLNGLSLQGVLAPELANLTHLKVLVLSDNHFSGAIPKELGELSMLEVLDLRNNSLNGTLPAELGGIHSLKRLLLYNNNFEDDTSLHCGEINLFSETHFDEHFVSDSVDGIRCLNRKIGKIGNCISHGGLKLLKKSDSYIIAIKGTLIHYLNMLPMFKFEDGSSYDNSDDCCHNLPSSSESYIQNLDTIVRRTLLEESNNLLARPVVMSTSDQIIALPSTRSSGSFPAVQKEKKQPSLVPAEPPKEPEQSTPNSVPKQPIEAVARSPSDVWKYLVGFGSAISGLFAIAALFFVCRSRAATTIGPWRTGLSGQLQKAFVTGVPKLNRPELETACEDFSNIIETHDYCTMYKGTLSSGVEIAVVSTSVSSLKVWSRCSESAYRKKIDSLSRVNHKNFVNLLGFCEENEPFTRMMVFEYAPNGTLFEHLHVKELEHLDWNTRMRIVMGTAYCLQYMHDLNPPVLHTNLNSNAIFLTDDYAAKIAEIEFWREIQHKSKAAMENESEHCELPPLADPETNVYSFGVMLLEIVSGKLPYSDEQGPIINWAAEYLNDKRKTNSMIDPTLKSFKEDEFDVVCEIIQECIQQDPKKRPTVKEIISMLRQVIDVSPEAATPRLSPLWWAELEILSAEAP